MSDVISIESRMAKIQADHDKRKEEWLHDPDSGAEYLRLALLHTMMRNEIEDIIIFDEEGEQERYHVGGTKVIPSKVMDDIIGYLYDVDGQVAYKLTRINHSNFVLHCLFDNSHEPEEIIFDYHVASGVDDALEYASRQHSSTRDYYREIDNGGEK
jgi:hypothetical protein